MKAVPVRVLLVEDSPSDAQLLKEYLSLAGSQRFDVTHVERLEEALAYLGSRTFDVVLLDLSLPDSAGHDTFRRAQKEAPHIPLVVLSGTSDEMLGIEAVRHGIQDYLVKGQTDERQITRAIRYAIERKRMEEALRQSEERFRLASDATRALVYDVDWRSGRAMSVHGLSVLLGYEPDEAPPTREWWFEQIHPDDLKTLQVRLQETVQRGGSEYSIQYHLMHKQGHRIVVEDTGQVVRDAGGQVLRLVGGVVDITRRKQLEEALQESEERLRLAVDAANEAIWDWNLIDGTVRWNETGARLLGQPAETESFERWWMEHLHPLDRERVTTSLRAAFESQAESWSCEYRFLRADGSWVDILDKASITRDQSGRATRAVGAMLDMTERKRAETALRESEERYRQLAAELEHKVTDRTADLQRTNRTLEMITDCNEAIVRAHREEDLLADICRIIIEVGGYRMAWVGFAQDDPAKTVLPAAFAGSEDGYLSRVRISWGDNEHGRGPTGTALRTGRPCVSRNFRTDPSLIPWREEALRRGFQSSIALPLSSREETFGALTIYALDPEAFGDEQIRVFHELSDDLAFGITALRTRAERNRALRTLEYRSAQLRTLASELTHVEERERRRLAQAIHDQLQQLLVGAKLCTDTLRRRCQTTSTEAVFGQLSEFVKESIEIARSLTFELSPPILYDVGLAAALEWLGRWMQAKHGLTVTVEADREIEPENEDVRVLLFQAVRELLFNVVKHAQVKTASVRMCQAEDDRVQIVVSDNGVGIDPSKSGVGENLRGGFGLFSIRGRLDLLGGEMGVESAPGHGCRFTLLAPLSSAPATNRPTASATVKQVAGPHRRMISHVSSLTPQKVRILLADDHMLVRQGLAGLLEEYGDIEVVGEAGDGQGALELVRQGKPDVVLMDVDMPRMNGIEATARLTAEFPGIKVIGLSMWEESDHGASMSEAGAIAYVNKAGPLEALINTIRRCFVHQ